MIRNGRVLDGTGSPWQVNDVGIRAGKIVSVGALQREPMDAVIDAKGMYVAPGFIDIHTHSDVGILENPSCDNAVLQGTTTHVIGNCGDSAAPLSAAHREETVRRFSYYSETSSWNWSTYEEYLAVVERSGIGVNVAGLVGHGTVRTAAMGTKDRPPTSEERERMRGFVDEAMRAGAFGMSTGLVYPPGCYAGTEEIVDLARIVARHGGFYASHVRGERETIVEAVRECVEIGAAAGCPVQISHNNPKYGGWGKAREVQAVWEAARARGLDVTADNDAHTDFGTHLARALPQWTHALGTDDLLAVVADPLRRGALRREIKTDLRPAFGPSGLLVHDRFDRIFLLRSPDDPAKEGSTVAQLAARRGVDPWSMYFDLIVESRDTALALFDYQDIEEIKATLRHPLVMICSDGWVMPHLTSTEVPPYNPCSYGEFPGILERFVVREPVLSLEEAVRKMTSMPAARLGLPDRGRLGLGQAADLVVFDLPRVRDRATNVWPHTYPYENYPHRAPEGIEWVIVNGQVAVAEGKATDRRAGRVLRHRG